MKERIQVGKHSSGYYPEKFPQPSKTGQHSNAGKTENTTKILREFVTTRPALQELLKEALHIERNNQYQPFQNHTKS